MLTFRDPRPSGDGYRSALPLATEGTQECRGLKERQLRLLCLDAPLSLVEVFFRQLEADEVPLLLSKMLNVLYIIL